MIHVTAMCISTYSTTMHCQRRQFQRHSRQQLNSQMLEKTNEIYNQFFSNESKRFVFVVFFFCCDDFQLQFILDVVFEFPFSQSLRICNYPMKNLRFMLIVTTQKNKKQKQNFRTKFPLLIARIEQSRLPIDVVDLPPPMKQQQ